MLKGRIGAVGALWLCFVAGGAAAQDVTIRVDPRQPGRPVSRYLTGACIEDVNHEIYGGIYSQMIFGESFQEPPTGGPVKGFVAVDGEWSLKDGEVSAAGGPGPKLVAALPPFTAGEAGLEVFLPGGAAGNAGLIVKVDRPGPGADNFDGYEVSLDAARGVVTLGRHRHDWTLLREVKWDVPPDKWVALSAKMTAETIEVLVDGKTAIRFEDRERPLRAGGLGLRNWQRPARYRRMWADVDSGRVPMPFEPNGESSPSAMWGAFSKGPVKLKADVEKDRPFVGARSQRITFTEGEGEVGIENRGLNRSGMNFAAGKPYEGYLWVRAEKPTDVFVSLESRDGARRYADARLSVTEADWRRLDFTLNPNASDTTGRFAVTLKAPGSVVLGEAFLQPGEWGRFKGLTVRKDVVEGLIFQGVTVLRYGGSMVNAPEYRWKRMLGPRDRRPPYRGHWYPHSTNGWGILDFLDLCEAAGFMAVPAFNMDEAPGDMADFMEYVNGPADSEWGRKRAAAGHPKPYDLRHVELGNEERVDETYVAKFTALAEAIWAKDPHVTLVVGDFAYNADITDPMKITRADSGVTSLAGHQKILELAKRRDRDVWFDVHLWTDGPAESPSVRAFPSYVAAIEKLAAGAKHKVVAFELNANNHSQRRALANAWAINAITRDGRVPVVASANCLQPDGHNDNGWDQGLLFLSPSSVWLQPPGYVTRMLSGSYQPLVLHAEVAGAGDRFDVTATQSEDGKSVVLRVVNLDENPRIGRIQLEGFAPSNPLAVVEELAAPLQAANPVANPTRVQPKRVEWRHEMKDGAATYPFAPHSFTVLRFE